MSEEGIQPVKHTLKDKLNFLIPSLMGVLLLMTPFEYQGQSTVAVSVISDFIRNSINQVVPIYFLILICITISFLLALIYKWKKPQFIEDSEFLLEVAEVNNFWLFVRFVGLVLAFAVAFGEQLGLPEIIWSDDTGGLILFDLINGLFVIFLVAGFILPLLTEFGLLEFVGIFLTKFMKPIFGLPGRSAVDCVASWLGDGTIGITLTNKQYKQGYYNAKEAAIISTTFSAVSITFCLVVVQNIGMMDKFGFFYLATAICGVVCALIVPRIPPLSRKPEDYYHDNEQDSGDTIPENYSRLGWGLHRAVKKAKSNGDFAQYMKSGTETVLSLWLGVIPTIMAIGTLVLILSHTTPVFDWLGIPFKPILELLQVPHATEAASTMVIGFADMVVPSIMAADIPTPMTQFVIAATSITQLIYMSETGAVILGSKLPVSFVDLFVIFIERTLVSLPIIVLLAHIIF